MSQFSIKALPLAVAMLFASTSMPLWAQEKSGATAGRADPADATARVPPVVHQSSFATYQPYTEQEVKNWRESNDNVGRIGGWRAYAKEARPPKPAAKNPPVPPTPAAAPSDAHKHH